MDIGAMREAAAGGSPLVRRRILGRVREAGGAGCLDLVYDLVGDESPFVAEYALDLAADLAAGAAGMTVRAAPLAALYRAATQRPFVRKKCVRALGAGDGPEALALLVAALADPEETVRAEAVEALVRAGGAALDALAAALVAPGRPWFAREAAAFALSLDGAGGGGNTFDRITAALDAADEELRFAVARAFKEVGNESWYRALGARFDLKPAEERAEIRRLLRGADDEARARALLALLARMDEKRCHDLLALLGDGEATLDDLMALEALLAGAPSDDARVTILRLLGLTRLEKSVPVIAAFLRDDDPRVRSHAVEALADIGRDYVMGLVDPLLSDHDVRVRASAARALWRLGGVGGLSSLTAMLRSTDRRLRVAAARALGGIGALQAVEALRPALSDGEEAVRAAAAKGLAESGDPAGLEAVMALACNLSETLLVRRTAFIALARAGGPEVAALLGRIAADPNETARLRETAGMVLSEMPQ